MLKTTRHKKGDRVVIALTGALDEHAATGLAKAAAVAGRLDSVTLDLAQVARINSLGIGLWAQFLRRLAQTARIELVACSVDFIDLANLAPAMTEGAQVISFYAPVQCQQCHTGSLHLAQTADVSGAALPLPPCSRCGGALETAVEPSLYLQFLDAV